MLAFLADTTDIFSLINVLHVYINGNMQVPSLEPTVLKYPAEKPPVNAP